MPLREKYSQRMMIFYTVSASIDTAQSPSNGMQLYLMIYYKLQT